MPQIVQLAWRQFRNFALKAVVNALSAITGAIQMLTKATLEHLDSITATHTHTHTHTHITFVVGLGMIDKIARIVSCRLWDREAA